MCATETRPGRNAAGELCTSCGVPPVEIALAAVFESGARGEPASALCTLTRPWCWRSVPATAMPAAVPASRKVLFIPEAIPPRHGGTTETAVEASVGFIKPHPLPAHTRAGGVAAPAAGQAR